MEARIIWTLNATADLERILLSAEHDPVDAIRFADSLIAAADSLSHHGSRGQIVPEFGNYRCRELLVKPYRLIYWQVNNAVHILALIHGARRANRR